MPSTSRMRLTTLAVLATTVGAVLVGLAYQYVRPVVTDPSPREAAQLAPETLGPRVLVVAPHPDDETINTGGLIVSCLERGARVKVVLMTVGDGYRRAAKRIVRGPLTPAAFLKLGRLRAGETTSACKLLGVPPEDVVLLGYGDGSLNSLWELEWDESRPHRALDGATSVPYEFAYRPGAPFCGASVAADLESIVREFRPTSVVYPDSDDRHHDHWATGAFTDYALEDVGYEGRKYTYLTHFYHYPFPWAYMPYAYLRPPSGLLSVGTSWHSMRLTESVRGTKLAAIGQYRSQMDVPDLRVYLLSFSRRNELYGTFELPRPATVATAGLAPSGVVGGVISRAPGPPLPASLVKRRGRISDLRLVRGPDVLWMGVRTVDRTPADLRYEFRLRLFGGSGARRVDVEVSAGKATALARASNSLLPTDLRTQRDADTLWVGLPASVLDDHTSGMAWVGSYTDTGEWNASRSAWRPFDL